VGHAVERNRLRRRLRAIFADLARQDPVTLQPGAYLVGCQAGATGLTHEELREHVSRALTRINRLVAR
jgi:ribonuclease P protein component